jgi:hypothetical protein
MRRLSVWAALAVVLAGGCACKRKPKQVEMVDDESQPALSVLHVAHPRADRQLLSGFHGVEQQAWRWTMGTFAVALEPPPGSAQRGATLELRFSMPESVISRRKSVTLQAFVAGTALAPETYNKAGDYTYTRDVPAAALAVPPVKVVFSLDHYLKAGEIDPRELGLVATSVGLISK